MHAGINIGGVILIAFKMDHQGVAQLNHQFGALFFVFVCQFLIRHEEIGESLQGASEFTQMLQRFFTSSERSPNGEHQGEDDRDTDQGEVHVEFNVVPKCHVRHDQGYDHGDIGSVVDDDKVLFHGSFSIKLS